MRLKRNYYSALKRTLDWTVSRFKPLTVHVEGIMLDSAWEEIKKRVKENKVKIWYIMTPVNRDHFNLNLMLKCLKKNYLK